MILHFTGMEAHTDPASILVLLLIGGCRNRKHNPHPSFTIMWRGDADLQIRAVACATVNTVYHLVERPPPMRMPQV
ncbi:MAG: hypothetical protein OXU68_15455 [Bacteroidota bacterium]|nr:hypothetical protein [Bacteroidota bacterium]